MDVREVEVRDPHAVQSSSFPWLYFTFQGQPLPPEITTNAILHLNDAERRITVPETRHFSIDNFEWQHDGRKLVVQGTQNSSRVMQPLSNDLLVEFAQRNQQLRDLIFNDDDLDDSGSLGSSISSISNHAELSKDVDVASSRRAPSPPAAPAPSISTVEPVRGKHALLPLPSPPSSKTAFHLAPYKQSPSLPRTQPLKRSVSDGLPLAAAGVGVGPIRPLELRHVESESGQFHLPPIQPFSSPCSRGSRSPLNRPGSVSPRPATPPFVATDGPSRWARNTPPAMATDHFKKQVDKIVEDAVEKVREQLQDLVQTTLRQLASSLDSGAQEPMLFPDSGAGAPTLVQANST